MNDLPLFDQAKFHGGGYEEAKDKKRLTKSLSNIYGLMSGGHKWSLAEIASHCNCMETTASAALRSLRNQYGYVIEKERVAGGKWLYWIAGGGMGEHSRTPRKMKPVGDPALFGKMMQAIYAYGKSYACNDQGEYVDMEIHTMHWARDMAMRIHKKLPSCECDEISNGETCVRCGPSPEKIF